ncbi:MAG: hypothetical protein GY813_19335 [Halieaceae bacterium]|nr:hypothetical protein [Halieaceae bacterium]
MDTDINTDTDTDTDTAPDTDTDTAHSAITDVPPGHGRLYLSRQHHRNGIGYITFKALLMENLNRIKASKRLNKTQITGAREKSTRDAFKKLTLNSKEKEGAQSMP